MRCGAVRYVARALTDCARRLSGERRAAMAEARATFRYHCLSPWLVRGQPPYVALLDGSYCCSVSDTHSKSITEGSSVYRQTKRTPDDEQTVYSFALEIRQPTVGRTTHCVIVVGGGGQRCRCLISRCFRRSRCYESIQLQHPSNGMATTRMRVGLFVGGQIWFGLELLSPFVNSAHRVLQSCPMNTAIKSKFR